MKIFGEAQHSRIIFPYLQICFGGSSDGASLTSTNPTQEQNNRVRSGNFMPLITKWTWFEWEKYESQESVFVNPLHY